MRRIARTYDQWKTDSGEDEPEEPIPERDPDDERDAQIEDKRMDWERERMEDEYDKRQR